MPGEMISEPMASNHEAPTRRAQAILSGVVCNSLLLLAFSVRPSAASVAYPHLDHAVPGKG
eukprot:575698-Lingulodinium_polyedra.AAC.1